MAGVRSFEFLIHDEAQRRAFREIWAKIDSLEADLSTDEDSGLTGSGASGRVAIWSSASALTSDEALKFSGGSLRVGTDIPAGSELLLVESERIANSLFFGSDVEVRRDVAGRLDVLGALRLTGHLDWSADGIYNIGASGGLNRPDHIYTKDLQVALTSTTGYIYFGLSGLRWIAALSDTEFFIEGMHFLFSPDNALDVGFSGISGYRRPRAVYVGTKLQVPQIDGGATDAGTLTLRGTTSAVTGDVVIVGDLTFQTDNIYDIGTSSTTLRPRDIFVGRYLYLADFTNATHSHQNAAGGGQLDHGLALTGLADDDHAQYALRSIMTTLGDVVYAGAAAAWTRLVGNITATKKFLSQTGTGAVSAAPSWEALVAGDYPDFVASGASHAKGAVPDPGAAAGTTKFLREDATWQVPVAGGATHNFLSATHPDTLAASVVLGDIVAGNATPAWVRVPGNTLASKRFLTQTGTGAVSAVPGWNAIVAGDIVELLALADLSDVTAKTGTGTIVVMDTSPAIVTPTIASFVNATHTHQAAAGGGQLDHGLALTGLGDDDHTQYVLRSVMTTLGDLPYFSTVWARLAGNITATKNFLVQTGTGTVSAAPTWGTIAAADYPDFVASGASHVKGAVPDPGAAAGTTKFLREDASWQVPAGGASTANQYVVMALAADLTAERRLQVGKGVSLTDGGADGDVTVGLSARGVRATLAADRTIATATATYIDFDAEDFDTDAFHDNATNNTRLTVPAGFGGKYLIFCSAEWVNNATGIRQILVRKNGTTITGIDTRINNGADYNVQMSLTFVDSLAAADYVEYRVYQSSGGNLTLSDANGLTFFGMVYLGA